MTDTLETDEAILLTNPAAQRTFDLMAVEDNLARARRLLAERKIDYYLAHRLGTPAKLTDVAEAQELVDVLCAIGEAVRSGAEDEIPLPTMAPPRFTE